MYGADDGLLYLGDELGQPERVNAHVVAGEGSHGVGVRPQAEVIALGVEDDGPDVVVLARGGDPAGEVGDEIEVDQVGVWDGQGIDVLHLF